MEWRAYRKVLRMVSELHVRGYQRIRIEPGMAASGAAWRCAMAPATSFSATHGARLAEGAPLAARYSSADEREYFGWTDAAHVTPGQLADLFIERFPQIVQSGKGSDWPYAGWYLEMLHITYPDSFPVAYADWWDFPTDYLPTTGARKDLRIPLPPAGWGPATRDG